MDGADLRNALAVVARMLQLGERSSDSDQHWLKLTPRQHVGPKHESA